MFSFLKKKSVKKTVAVFAVESGSVTLTITRIYSDKGEKIVFIDRRQVNGDAADTPTTILRKTVARIEDIFKDLLSRESFHLLVEARALVLLGSSWNVSWSDKISVQKEKPFRLTNDFLNESIKAKFSELHHGLSVISSHVMAVRVNGYEVKNPLGKVMPSVEFDAYVESAPREALSAIHDAISKHIPHSEMRFSTTAFAAVEAVLHTSKEKDFILILPEGSVTEISIVRGGSIKASASIPFGSITVARELFGVSINQKEGVDKLERFVQGGINTEHELQITAAFEQIKKKFVSDFHNALFTMNCSALCPSVVFIGGKSIAAGLIFDWIKKEDYASLSFTQNGFKVLQLLGGNMLDAKSFQGKRLPFVSAVSFVAAKNFANNKAFGLEESALE